MNDQINKLVEWYDNLDQKSLHRINEFYVEDCYFKDPFHEYNTLAELITLYEKMYKDLKNPRFKITRKFVNDREATVYWDFTFFALGKEMKIEGNTLFKFNAENKITHHIDYWDSNAELFSKLPVIGSMIRLFYKIAF